MNAHEGWAGLEELLEEGEIVEMIVLFRRRVRDLNPDGLRPSTLLLDHKNGRKEASVGLKVML